MFWMNFKRHLNLAGEHAFLSPSYYHWINYDPERLERRWYTWLRTKQGTELHAFAEHAINNKIRQDGDDLVSLYINECIDFDMQAEVILFYSENAFGTADAISFTRNILRISDLKTGDTATSEHQLEVYAALFSLEYDVDPYDIEIELRIYQSDEVRVYDAEPSDILAIAKKIIIFDHRIEQLKREEAV
jgi:Protein of unknown function (DUF2800)